MPSIYELKPRFQKFLSPLLSVLIRFKITPNHITVITLILSFIVGFMVAFFREFRWVVLLLPIFLFIRMALNALDGMLARTQNMSTKLGEILNEVGDVLSDTFLYLPLLCYVSQSKIVFLLIFLFVFLSAMSEFCGVLSKAMINVRRYDGPMGKSDRAFLVGLYGLIYFFYTNVKDYSVLIFSIACVLLMVSSFNRLKGILKYE